MSGSFNKPTHLLNSKKVIGFKFCHKNSIFDSAIISLADKMLVFGGCCPSSTVAMFQNDSWLKIGELSEPRYGHNVINSENGIFIVGGSQNQ